MTELLYYCGIFLITDISNVYEKKTHELITMAFLSETPDIVFNNPLFCGILGNTLLSTVPGVSGAGATPENTLLTPVLDAELVTHGAITSHPCQTGYSDRLPDTGINYAGNDGVVRYAAFVYQCRSPPQANCSLS